MKNKTAGNVMLVNSLNRGVLKTWHIGFFFFFTGSDSSCSLCEQNVFFLLFSSDSTSLNKNTKDTLQFVEVL